MTCPEKYAKCPHCRSVWNNVFFGSEGVANFLGAGVAPADVLRALQSFPSDRKWLRVAMGYDAIVLRSFRRPPPDASKISCEELHVVNAGLDCEDVSGLLEFVQCFTDVAVLNLEGNNLNEEALGRVRKAVGKSTVVRGEFNENSVKPRRRSLHGACETLVAYEHAVRRRQLPDMEQDRRVKEAIRVLGTFVDGALRGKPRDWELRVFGSGKSGLYNPDTSDVDMTIVFGSLQLRDEKEEKEFSKKVVKSVGYKLKSRFKEVEVLPWPRIPLIRIMNEFGLKEINIVVGNDMGLLNSSLLREYCLVDPVVFDLGQRVKQWAKANELVDAQCLSSYGWVLLLVFFLIARLKIIPNLQNMPESTRTSNPGEIVGDRRATFWGSSHRFDTRFMTADFANSLALTVEPRPASWEPILAEFFRFYAFEFSWERQSVDIAEPARALRERHFDDEDNGNKFVALLDPFESDTRNLAKGISPGGFKKIKEALEKEARLHFT